MAARRCDAVLAVSKWQRLALTPRVTLVGRPLWSVITPWNGVRFIRGCDIDGAALGAAGPTLASVGKSAEVCDFSWLRRRDDSETTPKSVG